MDNLCLKSRGIGYCDCCYATNSRGFSSLLATRDQNIKEKEKLNVDFKSSWNKDKRQNVSFSSGSFKGLIVSTQNYLGYFSILNFYERRYFSSI